MTHPRQTLGGKNEHHTGEGVIVTENSARKRLLFVLNSMGCGGAERQTIELVNRLDEKRFDVSLCYFVREEAFKDKIHAERLSELSCLDKRRKLDLGLLRRLIGISERFRPDTIVCVNLYPTLYMHPLRMLTRSSFNIVHVLHSTLMCNSYEEYLRKYLYMPLIKRSEAVVFVCRNQMAYWLERFRIDTGRCVVIHNGVDVDNFRPTRSQEQKTQYRASLGISPDDVVVGILAALRPEKSHGDLIEATRRLIAQGIPVKLLIVGDGPNRSVIEAQIDRAGIRHHTVMTGFQKDVRPCLEIADIVAITSTAETFSIAILEAMALGKAIVASDIGGASEQIIPGVNGYLFPSGNIDRLSGSIGTIISSGSAVGMGRKSRELVCEKYSVDTMVRKYEQMLLEQ